MTEYITVGKTVRIVDDDTPRTVQVVAWSEHLGYRVSNKAWGGGIDRWVKADELVQVGGVS